jgi:hypothetical protein
LEVVSPSFSAEKKIVSEYVSFYRGRGREKEVERRR